MTSAEQRQRHGDDGITIGMLRMTFPVVGPSLLSVINASLTSGKLPPEWKVATVVPLHKTGSVTDPTNYRPVSILPAVAKVAESVVTQQLMHYLISHSILSETQHGFRPGRSTESAVLDAVGYLMSGLDGGFVGCLTTADTSKAFDSVRHARLLTKLAWYGTDDHWFEDWLRGRVQKVRGGHETLPITHGVVQGSLLGPTLFLLFTNDLASHFDSKIVMYADDVQFLHQDTPDNLPRLQNRVQNSLEDAQRWFVENSLKINPVKTDLVLVRHRQRHTLLNFEVIFGAAKIKPSASVKILGVAVDNSLTFDDHVSLVIRRCYATLGGLSKLSNRLPKEVKKMIVETLVFPHLSYCLTAWAGCGKTQRHRVQKVINHCAQVVFGVRRSSHVTPLLRELGWPTIEQLISECDISRVYSLMTSPHAPASLCDNFVYRGEISGRETRAAQGGALQLPRVRTELARRYFNYRATKQWNLAPSLVKEAPTAARCRKSARKWILASTCDA